jgi:upstream activation factor subunit UAF30
VKAKSTGSKGTPTPPPETAKVEPETSDVLLTEEATEFQTTIMEYNTKLIQLGAMVNTLKADFRNLNKLWSREHRAMQRATAKKKKSTRLPSGFVKPAKISDQLAAFLKKEKGSEMARTEVTREINQYIRANNLQDSNNGRKINADSKLKELLNLKKDDELTYFNLQRYMSPHFCKESDVVKTATK